MLGERSVFAGLGKQYGFKTIIVMEKFVQLGFGMNEGQISLLNWQININHPKVIAAALSLTLGWNFAFKSHMKRSHFSKQVRLRLTSAGGYIGRTFL